MHGDLHIYILKNTLIWDWYSYLHFKKHIDMRLILIFTFKIPVMFERIFIFIFWKYHRCACQSEYLHLKIPLICGLIFIFTFLKANLCACRSSYLRIKILSICGLNYIFTYKKHFDVHADLNIYISKQIIDVLANLHIYISKNKWMCILI